MDDLLSESEITEDLLLQKAMSRSDNFTSFIWELDKLLTITQSRIESLASQNQQLILGKQHTLQAVSENISILLKKSSTLDNRLSRLKRNFTEEIDTISNLLRRLDVLSKTSETIKVAQTLLLKSKNPNANQQEIQILREKVKGLKL